MWWGATRWVVMRCCVMWCGVLWCDVMWWDAMSYDKVWLVSFVVMWWDVVWCDVMWGGVIWFDVMMMMMTMRCGVIRFDKGWCEVMRCDVIRCDVIGCDVGWCNVMRCDVMGWGKMWGDVSWCDVIFYSNKIFKRLANTYLQVILTYLLFSFCSPSQGLCCSGGCTPQNEAFLCLNETECSNSSFCKYPLWICSEFSCALWRFLSSHCK